MLKSMTQGRIVWRRRPDRRHSEDERGDRIGAMTILGYWNQNTVT
jgi:hypothetical protein